jgi:hypothetical protein
MLRDGVGAREALFGIVLAMSGCGSVKHYSTDDPHHGLIKVTCARNEGCRERAVQECPDGYREVSSGARYLTFVCRDDRHPDREQ